MGEILSEHAGYAVEYDVQQMIYRPETAQAYPRRPLAWGKERSCISKSTPHGRYGCDYDHALETLQQCRRYPHLFFEGVMTHFPLSDAVDKSFPGCRFCAWSGCAGSLNRAALTFLLAHVQQRRHTRPAAGAHGHGALWVAAVRLLTL
jgi:alanine racemase